MTYPTVFTEKLRRPDAVGLARLRLESPFLTGAAAALIGLVIGPPGSGKTTLLGRVAAQARGPVAWYRLTSDDASEVAFAAHLGVALGRALELPGTPGAGISDLLQALEDWPGGKAVLVLDDVHEIVGSAAEHALEQFVALRPRALQVLIGSRRQPDINIPRLQVSGQLHEISGEDLRFRSWEVEELFLSIFEEPLSPESAAALTRRTGGWAAGLQLFHLATRGRSAGDRHRAVTELNGRSKLVRSYLARNVIADLPEDRRDFLLKTSTLGTLTSELCDSLLGRVGSGRILDELEQQQLFTSSADDGETFHYHEVLRAHLEWALIEEFGLEHARSWYSRSAIVLEAAGNHHAAIRAHAKAEDWGAVARLLQSHESNAAGSAAGMNLVLPPSVVQYDPWLSLAEARRRLRHGAAAGAATAFAQAESLLDEPAFRDSCRRERAVATMWTAVDSRADWADLSRPQSDHWSATVRQATRRASLSPEPIADGDAHEHRLGWGLAALLAGRVEDARGVLGDVADRTADPTHALLAKLAVTVIDIVTVGLDDPVDRLESITIEAEFVGLPWVERLSRGLAESLLIADGSIWRVAASRDIVAECERDEDPWGAAVLRLAGALAQQLARSPGGSDDFADAAVRFHQLDAPVPALWADALRACAIGSEQLLTEVRTTARTLHLPLIELLATIGSA
ncbi:MAG: AAA family ATPase, partial [Nakamurella sp.]